MNRRSFLKNATAAAAVTASLPAIESIAATSAAQPAPNNPMIGIQVGAVSFVDEGVEPVLDEFQQCDAVNTLSSPPSPTAAASQAARFPASRCPITASRTTIPTLSTAAVTRRPSAILQGTVLKISAHPTSATTTSRGRPPSARKRGMKTICWFEDVWSAGVPNVRRPRSGISTAERRPPSASTTLTTQLAARHWSRTTPAATRSTASCGDPSVRAHSPTRSAAIMEDVPATQQGHLLLLLRAQSNSARGINAARARDGFQALADFVGAARKEGVRGWLLRHALASHAPLPRTARLGDALDRQPPRNLRRHLRQSEIGQSRRFRSAGTSGTTTPSVPSTAPSRISPTIAPVLRLPQDRDVPQLRRRAHGAASSDNVGQTMYGDVPSRSCSISTTASSTTSTKSTLAALPQSGLSADYVYRETKRARAGLDGTKTLLWPGIDIDIPTAATTASPRPKAPRPQSAPPSVAEPTASSSPANTLR